ncbi:DNA polymerase III subunit delta [Legionella gresilensis]|uniref:DNA polymerase III subunit delta n=1 Tax=Legionella gresilensis TaxID=91823 RepID=UPI001040E2AE|nr:DNA polymerase III subunit delta [Legionella gresilensis]
MFSKYNSLTVQLPKKLPAIFFLLGQELFQINQLTQAIKQAWLKQHDNEIENTTVFIESATDWTNLETKANSYALFTNTTLIDVRYDKKLLESVGKSFLNNYLENPNSSCLLIFKAPNLPPKQLQFIFNHELVSIIQVITPNTTLIKKWLHEHLQKFGLSDPHIATLIYQFNEGNLFACAQFLEKLELIHEPHQSLTLDEIKDHLHNQSNYSLFELAQTCLAGDATKAIQILKQTYHNKTEPTLILWLLAQEIRLLMKLHHLTQNGASFQNAANQLKIWSTKLNLYQAALKRYDFSFLSSLLQHCKHIDIQIKTTQSKQVWQLLEGITLSLCTTKKVGLLCLI